MPSSPCLSREEEHKRILSNYKDSFPDIMAMLERQFMVLHNRAQVLLALCGIVISTTGFSGRIIAGTNSLAQWLIISGISFILVSAAIVVWGVLHLRWLTLQPGKNLSDWLMISLDYRDRKTNWYRVGISILLVGLVLYCAAIAVMLRNPHESNLPAR